MPTLDWATREADMAAADRVPYRLLDDVPALAGGTGEPSGLLVQGDNLEALKALLPFYGGRVRCIYIDPPYNTRSAFEHYDDNLEHAKWLGMIVPRLQLLREFLSEDGSIWVSIDDNEGHYLKVVMDEVFGRRNFINEVCWRSSDNSNNDAKTFSTDHNTILIYGCNSDWLTKKSIDPNRSTHFTNPDNNSKGPYFDGNPLGSPSPRPNLMFDLEGPTGEVIKHPKNGWRWSRETINTKFMKGEIRFSEDGKRIRRRTYLADQEGLPPSSLWHDLEETGHNRQAKSEQKKLAGAEVELFSTPKPERLLQRILHIASDPGDLVLDSFLGSGTTAAVAHKMGRRWIGIEMGDHARTHAAARLTKVINGEQGGISKDVDWQGGGAFRFATLGAEAFDGSGRINPDVTWSDLAAHVWFAETRRARTNSDASDAGPVIGIHKGGAVALLWNGVLKDRSASGGNVLVHPVLRLIREDIARRHPNHDGPLTIYGAATRLSPATLKAERVTFKQTPYAVAHRV